MKQTAVEWLIEQIKSDHNQKTLSAGEWMQVIEEAKLMEKDQLRDSWFDGLVHLDTDWTFEEYYNETYGKDESNH